LEDTTIVARHLNVMEAIKKYALQKAGKIKKFFEWILHIQITLDIGGDNSHLVEMIVSISRGAPLVAKSSDSDMCRAIYLAVDKIESQLKKHKGKIQSGIIRRKRPTTIGTEDFQDIPDA
jgi:ribosome hibernation promoting factor